MLLIDSDVLIWYLIGNLKTYEVIESQNSFFISAVTYMELVQGMRNKNELTELRKSLNKWNSKIKEIAKKNNSQYQKVIRNLLDQYASRYSD